MDIDIKTKEHKNIKQNEKIMGEFESDNTANKPINDRDKKLFNGATFLSEEKGYKEVMLKILNSFDFKDAINIIKKIEFWENLVATTNKGIFTIICDDDSKFKEILDYIIQRMSVRDENVLRSVPNVKNHQLLNPLQY